MYLGVPVEDDGKCVIRILGLGDICVYYSMKFANCLLTIVQFSTRSDNIAAIDMYSSFYSAMFLYARELNLSQNDQISETC